MISSPSDELTGRAVMIIIIIHRTSFRCIILDKFVPGCFANGKNGFVLFWGFFVSLLHNRLRRDPILFKKKKEN